MITWRRRSKRIRALERIRNGAQSASNPSVWTITKRDGAVHFEKWVKKLNILYTGFKITNTDQKKTIPLHYGGYEQCDILDTLTIPEGGDVYTKSIDAHFASTSSVDKFIYAFRKGTQKT